MPQHVDLPIKVLNEPIDAEGAVIVVPHVLGIVGVRVAARELLQGDTQSRPDANSLLARIGDRNLRVILAVPFDLLKLK